MTSTFVRVDPGSLEITLKYNTNGGAKWAEDDLECTIPFDVLVNVAVRAEDGSVTLQADPQKVEAKTAQAWTALRTQRNSLLQQSDWTQLQDSHISQDKKDAWAAYRQELRDLPDELGAAGLVGSGPPGLFNWPLKPGEIPPTPVNSSRLGALLEHAGEEVPVVEAVAEVPAVPAVEETPVVEPVEEVTEPVVEGA